MRALIFLVYVFFCATKVSGEESKYSLGPLPPITNSLIAPVQIDEGNTNEQENFTSASSQRLQSLIQAKRFPVEIVLVGLALLFIYLYLTRMRPAPEVIIPPSITEAERIEQAKELLEDAGEELSDTEALTLFQLLDPMVESLPDPVHYLQVTEKVKFAGYPLKKSEFIEL